MTEEVLRQLKGKRASSEAVMALGPRAALRKGLALPDTFSIDLYSGSTLDQKGSNRCWILASMNPLRREAARRLGISESGFFLSSGYIAFYDQLERSELFLDRITRTRGKSVGEIIDLLRSPIPDTGQWHRFSYLADKYGVVPSSSMPETFNFSDPSLCSRLLSEYLRKCAWELREECPEEELEERKLAFLSVIYGYLCRNYGEPAEMVSFSYVGADGNKKEVNLTPRSFYRDVCGAHPEDYIFFINHPSEAYPYLRTYTEREDLTRGYDTMLNVDIDTLRRLTLRQLQAGEMVVFGSDSRQQNDGTAGAMDACLFDYKGVLGIDLSMSKEMRIKYHNIQATHIMTFDGVETEDGKPSRWKALNSRGDSFGRGGHYVMTDSWFSEYVLSAVIRKDLVDDYLLEAYEKEPLLMPVSERYL